MNHYLKTEFEKGTSVTNIYSNITGEELSQKVEQMLTQSGYKRTSASANPATYVKGNRVMRLLFGAFCKYFIFTVTIQMVQEGAKLTISSNTSGMSGGAIGMTQVKDEFKRIKQLSMHF